MCLILFFYLVLFEVFSLLSNFVNNLSKELKNKIQDRLYEFNHTLFENPEKKWINDIYSNFIVF